MTLKNRRQGRDVLLQQATQNPWRVVSRVSMEESYGEAGHVKAVVIGYRHFDFTCSGMAGKPEDYDLMLAAAHLVSSAPELQDALEQAVTILAAMEPQPEGAERVIERAKKALAKARGGLQ